MANSLETSILDLEATRLLAEHGFSRTGGLQLDRTDTVRIDTLNDHEATLAGPVVDPEEVVLIREDLTMAVRMAMAARAAKKRQEALEIAQEVDASESAAQQYGEGGFVPFPRKVYNAKDDD